MRPDMKSKGVECLRVLVVDDHKDTADSCAQLVLLWGHAAMIAYDGATAVEAARSFQPHVILLDLEMPQLDGFEVYRKIRAQAGASATVIAVSGHGQKEIQDRSVAEGFFCHLTKPVEPQRLEAILAILKANCPSKFTAESADTVK